MEREIALRRTFALFHAIFFVCLFVDSVQLKIYTERIHLIPDFEFLLPLADFIAPYVEEIFLFLRALTAICAFYILFHPTCSVWWYRVLTLDLAFCYFMSMMDTFQHHYLIGLMLFLLSLSSSVGIRCTRMHRPMQLLLSVIYFWTAVTKFDSGNYQDGSQAREIIFGMSGVEQGIGNFVQWGIISGESMLWLVDNGSWMMLMMVISMEVVLAICQALIGFSFINVGCMVLLHGFIAMAEFANPLMKTNLFSIYMLAAAILSIPPTSANTNWIEYVLPSSLWYPFVRQLFEENERDRNRKWKWSVWIILLLFFYSQAVIPYMRCYKGKTLSIFQPDMESELEMYQNNPSWLDERFCWRMFSGVQRRQCYAAFFAHIGTATPVRIHTTLYDKIDVLMNQSNLRISAKKLCGEFRDQIMELNETTTNLDWQLSVRYIGYCKMSFAEGNPVVLADWEVVSC